MRVAVVDVARVVVADQVGDEALVEHLVVGGGAPALGSVLVAVGAAGRVGAGEGRGQDRAQHRHRGDRVVDATAAPVAVVGFTDHADDIDVALDAEQLAERDREGGVVHPLRRARDHRVDVRGGHVVGPEQILQLPSHLVGVADGLVAVGEAHLGVRRQGAVGHGDHLVGPAGEAVGGEVGEEPGSHVAGELVEVGPVERQVFEVVDEGGQPGDRLAGRRELVGSGPQSGGRGLHRGADREAVGRELGELGGLALLVG